MPKPKQRCPSCNCYAFRCVSFVPTTMGAHELESGRVSYWECKECGARYELRVPEGKLRRIRQGEVTEDMFLRCVGERPDLMEIAVREFLRKNMKTGE